MTSTEDSKQYEEEDQQTNWMVCIPRDISGDITSRLPIKSLIRFRFVCKTWKTLSQDPEHTAFYHYRALHRNPCLILHSNSPLESEIYFAEFSGYDEDEIVVRKIQNPSSMNIPSFNVVGSSSGLLCLVNSSLSTGDELYIYNPFTRDYKELPKLSMSKKLDGMFGFGFHSKTKEFKIIKIGYPRISLCFRSYIVDNSKSLRSEVQILTLGNKIWRNIGEVPYKLEKRSGVSINGRIHWLSEWIYRFNDRIIVSFDISDEVFKEVPKPNFHDGSIGTIVNFFFLKGVLQLLFLNLQMNLVTLIFG